MTLDVADNPMNFLEVPRKLVRASNVKLRGGRDNDDRPLERDVRLCFLEVMQLFIRQLNIEMFMQHTSPSDL